MGRYLDIPEEELKKELGIAFDMMQELAHRALGTPRFGKNTPNKTIDHIITPQVKKACSELSYAIEEQSEMLCKWLMENWDDTVDEAARRGSANPEIVAKCLGPMLATEHTKILTAAIRSAGILSMIRDNQRFHSSDADVQMLMLKGALESMFSQKAKEEFTDTLHRMIQHAKRN